MGMNAESAQTNLAQVDELKIREKVPGRGELAYQAVYGNPLEPRLVGDIVKDGFHHRALRCRGRIERGNHIPGRIANWTEASVPKRARVERFNRVHRIVYAI